ARQAAQGDRSLGGWPAGRDARRAARSEEGPYHGPDHGAARLGGPRAAYPAFRGRGGGGGRRDVLQGGDAGEARRGRLPGGAGSVPRRALRCRLDRGGEGDGQGGDARYGHRRGASTRRDHGVDDPGGSGARAEGRPHARRRAGAAPRRAAAATTIYSSTREPRLPRLTVHIGGFSITTSSSQTSARPVPACRPASTIRTSLAAI